MNSFTSHSCAVATATACLLAMACAHASQPRVDDSTALVNPVSTIIESSEASPQKRDSAITQTLCCEDTCCGDGCSSDDCCGSCASSDCCNSCCGGGFDLSCGLCSCECLGEPCTLADQMCCPITVGGWFSAGYHSDNTRQSFQFNDLLAYNDVPDQLNLHQGWVYFEKETCARRCNTADYGFRFDAVYGTDAQALQANGAQNAATQRNVGFWDASLDHGEYGWALPQAYGEIAYNDWKVKAGYFLSLIGYESSLAPENFFYSHSLTMFNSEPFTHTGVIAENNSIDGLTIFAGWVMGWDAAWRQEFGGSAFLGGFSAEVIDDVWFTYMLNAGDFGFRGDNGYNHSIVLEAELTDRLEYALQSDYFNADNVFNTPGVTVEEYGIVQYLYYYVTDRVALGGRIEWWNSNSVTANSQSYYEVTGGVNIRPNANLTIRPEIRYDWTPGNVNFANATGFDYNNTVFGIDAVLVY